MGRQLAVLGIQTAEIDEPAECRVPCRRTEGMCHLAVGVRERSPRAQGVDQVVRHVDALQGLGHVVCIAGVCFDDLDVSCPGRVAQRRTGSRHDPEPGSLRSTAPGRGDRRCNPWLR